MRAVNLIPGDAGRAGAAGGALGAYAVVGVLAVLLVGALAYVLSHNTVVERRAELASVQAQAVQAQAQADKIKPYRDFASMAEARLTTIRQLGATRFDWNRAFGELAKVIPDDVWLSSLVGTVADGVPVEGAAGGSTATVRSALPNPAIELIGCTTSQDKVARMISRLRLMSGVARVSLADSSKDESSSGEDCRHGDPRFPQFGVVVFFDALPTPPAPPTSDPATGAETAASADAGATPPPIGGSTAGTDMR